MKELTESRRVSPFGLTLPNALKRLQIPPEDQNKDAETIIMRMWDEKNTRDPSRGGLTPIDRILHVCGDDCGKKKFRMPMEDEHVYSKPSEHDIMVMAATVQWLATNVGRSFYQDFLSQWHKANKDGDQNKYELVINGWRRMLTLREVAVAYTDNRRQISIGGHVIEDGTLRNLTDEDEAMILEAIKEYSANQ